MFLKTSFDDEGTERIAFINIGCIETIEEAEAGVLITTTGGQTFHIPGVSIYEFVSDIEDKAK